MKKFALLFPLLISIITLSPLAGDAAYIIYLDNGAQLLTPHYWQEGKQVMFYIMGGSAGIEKKYVKKIEKSSAAATVAPSRPKPEPARSPAKPTVDAAAKTATAPKAGNGEDQRFMKDFNLLMERFQRVDNMASQELYAFIKDLRAFRDKILASGLGNVYDQQLLEVANMGNRAAEVLKESGQ